MEILGLFMIFVASLIISIMNLVEISGWGLNDAKFNLMFGTKMALLTIGMLLSAKLLTKKGI